MIGDAFRKYDVAVPRYTSYPTAAQFTDRIGPDDYGAWLRSCGASRPSLYLHVPFCRSLCYYCACHMQVVNRPDILRGYADCLIDEARLVAGVTDIGPPIAVHWGGGTPTHLGAREFSRTAAAILRQFPLAGDAEHSVEIDPRTFDDDIAAALADSGVTRASLGVQDFDPAVQRAINRMQSVAETAATVSRLHRVGIERINLDLVYGLPAQTMHSLRHTIESAIDLKPSRLAVFGYAHVPWMKAHQKLIPDSTLPDGPLRLEMAEAIAERLTAAGFVRIGLDHYARPDDPLTAAARAGRLRRSFQGYSDVATDATIGLGASAISDLSNGLAQNHVSVRAYQAAIAERRFATARGVSRSGDDRLRAEIIEGLLCEFSIDLAAVIPAHGGDLESFSSLVPALDTMAADGLIRRSDTKIEITPEGRPWARVVAALFDRYLPDGAGPRHSRAV